MALVVSGISLPFEAPEEEAVATARRLAGTAGAERAYIVKKSLDARKKKDIRFVYSVALEVEAETATTAVSRPGVAVKEERPLRIERGRERLSDRPVVVGFGPAGMFAALLLAREGLCPLVLEQGQDVDTRVDQVRAFWSTGALHPLSNVQFGEGGAGTFSDGKLVTRIGDERCRFVLEQFAAHGAPEEIRYQAKPHVGTDRLRNVVKSIREEIIRLGGAVRFGERLTGLRLQKGRMVSALTDRGEIPARVLVLAPGHSARDVFGMLRDQGIPLEAKPFSVGARIEHRQREIDRALYGELAGHPLLPRGEYQLSHREGERAVYTFCMCPGGEVVAAASEEGMVVTNGMSRYARDGENANAALVVSVTPGDFGNGPLDGVEFQRRLERAAWLAGGGQYLAPAQGTAEFLRGVPGLSKGGVQPTYSRGIRESQLDDVLPGPVVEMMKTGLRRFDRKLPGFAGNGAVLTGVESRTSSPVRIPRGENLQSGGAEGLYPCGEGAGYAGGIVSAAVDGVRVAQEILAQYGNCRDKDG